MKKSHFTFDKSLYNMFEELITYSSIDGKIIDCNKSFAKFIGKPKKELIKKDENRLLHLVENQQNRQILFDKKRAVYEEFAYINKEKVTFFETKRRLIESKDPTCSTILTIRKNLTKIKTNFAVYKEYKKLLKQIANGDDLMYVLENLVTRIEKKDEEMICSVLFLDKSGKRLFTGAAPSLPDFYTQKVNGMEIGDNVGSCGAAASLKKRVIVDNIQKHDNWVLARNLALRANLHACWSQPIFSSKGEVLGTFAIYYNRPKKPTKFELLLIKDAASIAGLAIEKHKNEYKIQKNIENEKKQEQLLMHKSKQAMMGEMLENIAHQWRQPLSAITTCATGVQLKRELGESSKAEENEALENINLNAQYLSQTIEDFRYYFKSDNQLLKFNVKESYYHTLKLINARLKTQNINIIENIEDIIIVSLENELTQVFMNILNNSIDELENFDKDKRMIRIKIYKDKNDVIIKIIDSAGGAKKDILERIFEPYFTTKHQSQGTGIGLYMCKEIIEKHIEGSIEARNNSFKYQNKTYSGLEFMITIPIA